jgi:outer membrane protein TolC
LRPSNEPTNAPIIFDWNSIAVEAVQYRPEIRKQRLVVERRRLELLAAKNYLLPQFDLYGKYRFRGLDRNLAGSDSALGDLGTGDFQEWETGFELSVPIGFRQAHAAWQNARQLLLREELILREQERRVVNDLGSMVAEVERAYLLTETNFNRYFAAADAVDSMEANRKAGLPVNIEQLLDAQRRLADAQQRYYQSRAEYAVAIKNVHVEKGSLLAEYQLFIGEVVARDQQPPTEDLLPVNQVTE